MDNNRLHTEHSAGVLPESACLSCPVNLGRYPPRIMRYTFSRDEFDDACRRYRFQARFDAVWHFPSGCGLFRSASGEETVRYFRGESKWFQSISHFAVQVTELIPELFNEPSPFHALPPRHIEFSAVKLQMECISPNFDSYLGVENWDKPIISFQLLDSWNEKLMIWYAEPHCHAMYWQTTA